MKYFLFVILLGISCSYAQDVQKDKIKIRTEQLIKDYNGGNYKDALISYSNFNDITAEEYYYLGLSSVAIYNYTSAIEYLQKANELNNSNTGYEYQLAKTYQAAGKTALAEKHFTNILQREPSYVPVLFDSGILDFSQLRFADAAGKFRRVLKSAPANFMAYYNLAKSLSFIEPREKYADSVEIFLSTCVTINNDFLPAVEMLANLFFNKKNYDHAYSLFLSASQKYPAKGNYTYLAGMCKEKEGDYEKAIELFNEAIKLNGEDARYWDHLGFSQYALKKYSESINSYKKAITIDNENSTYYINLAYAYSQADSSKKAVEEFQYAIVKMHPEMIGDVFCQIGHVYFKEKNYKEARKTYQRVLQYDGENIDAYYMGAISDDELGSRSAALTGYKKALQLIKEKSLENELAGNERYNTIRKRIADLSKSAGSKK